MDVAALSASVAHQVALRRRRRLQPVGGPGDKIFPPTYPGENRTDPPRHVFERRRIEGQDVWCVLVDSVQSQANRLEQCLLDAIDEGVANIPHVVVDFAGAGVEPITRITSLDAPHRIYDAILRDSDLEGQSFMDSVLGQRLKQAKPESAAALLEVSPTALLFGAWHSTGEGGGLGAKFARCLVSEVFAVGTPVEDVPNTRGNRSDVQTAARRTGSRIDPLGTLRRVEVYEGENGWELSAKAAGKNAKLVRPSEINHGNIAPSVSALGVTCDYVEHNSVLSFAALRRLRFGGGDKDAAGRAFLAALGILAIVEQDARGYALRSRCDLVCDGPGGFELVDADGTTRSIDIVLADARAIYAGARAAALAAGLALAPAAVMLKPKDKLVGLIRESQRLALADAGGEGENG
ncbi:MAG: type I-U CRISPR-associated protein Cas7 [Hyphomicrobiaceae bacterium]|nr:type I-U CRISPR-associated protein Cas7 [Hyphomicrobiaceae bacterium]